MTIKEQKIIRQAWGVFEGKHGQTPEGQAVLGLLCRLEDSLGKEFTFAQALKAVRTLKARSGELHGMLLCAASVLERSD